AVNPPGRLVALPHYPWQRRRYWIDAGEARRPATDGRPGSSPATAPPVEEPEHPNGSGVATTPDVAAILYEQQWPEKGRAQPAPARIGGRWLILEDARGVGRALGRLLEDRGASCTLVRSRWSLRSDRSFGQVVDPCDGDAVRRLLAPPPGGDSYR